MLSGDWSSDVCSSDLPNEPTGDGILTALMITKIISETKKPLFELKKIIKKSPQIILNFPATEKQKQNLKTLDAAKKLLLEYDQKLKNESGRLLVRPSGTENLIRITMWGNSENIIQTLAENLREELTKIL